MEIVGEAFFDLKKNSQKFWDVFVTENKWLNPWFTQN